MRSLATALLSGAMLSFLAGCAKMSAPAGGEPDLEPPRVVVTEPAQFSVNPGWDGTVVIRFDERISEKRIKESVLVSPRTGAVRVKKGRSELRISLEGGWRAGQVYRVVLLPVLQDLFGNTLQEEVELVFSTGPEIPASTIAGQITDRLTAKPVAGARVEAISESDSTIYVALSDTAGLFALRHIPPGDYVVRPFLDRNRNTRLDFGEPLDSGSIQLGTTDTTIVSYRLLPSDTTPTRVLRAEARDSLQIRVSLDDHLDPQVPLDGIEVELRSLPDSVVVGVGRVEQIHQFEVRRAAERALADTLQRAAKAVVDSAAAGADSVGPVRPGESAARIMGSVAPERRGADAAALVGAQEPSEPLPARELVIVPEAPLPPETKFWLRISGIRNINGIEGGGGSVVFETAAAPEPAAPDSAGVELPEPAPPDSGGARPAAAGPRLRR